MATMTVRTTFALDKATDSAISRLARLWGISKAEVVRRSVADAEKMAVAQTTPTPLEALEWLQSHGTLTEEAVENWRHNSRRGWEEGWKRREFRSSGARKSKAKGKR